MADVFVTVTNNSGQTSTLRFPEGSELPAYLKTLERREELAKVVIKTAEDKKGKPAAEAAS